MPEVCVLQLSPIYVNTVFARKITILKLNRKCSIGSCMIAGLSLSAGCLPAKFAGWEKGHRRLNFGWWTLGKGIEQFFGYALVWFRIIYSEWKGWINSWLPWVSMPQSNWNKVLFWELVYCVLFQFSASAILSTGSLVAPCIQGVVKNWENKRGTIVCSIHECYIPIFNILCQIYFYLHLYLEIK